ncbi:radical SAM family heme chaperone HemW [Poseidonocella sp. HB161398]|uniref:radical SAM family heme chaperone HemW n=1 Tax=Poseidonocella sp. HB161398 TaxID=2320855 RepID=UPI0011082B06|nr:radical SAM family heme chaperone HemW [Poseidonocella sp. HB161398]
MDKLDTWQEAGFGLYLHWPFCAAKCPYCDFNSHVAAAIDQRAWTDAYITELRRSAGETQGRILSTVFFGGGTPSLMAPETVAAILDEIRRLWPMVNDPEITLEANPTSVEAGRFAGYAQAGVTRLSMGVQSLNDDDLRRLGRLHSVAEARRAFDIARAQFSRVSFDLIYARQGQSLDMWRSELREALDMAVDHLSLYQLTIEPGTAFGDRFAAGRLRDLPDDDIAADMYDATQEICGEAGLPAYEVSNHARPGSESRHNTIYWRGGDWVGIGPGAHGRIGTTSGRLATETELNPGLWMQRVRGQGSGETARALLSPTETAEEYLMMSLRLAEGTDMSRLARLGHRLDEEILQEFEEMGMVIRNENRLSCTQAGRLVLNEILRRLMVG